MLEITQNKIFNNKLLLCYTKRQSDLIPINGDLIPKYDSLFKRLSEELGDYNKTADKTVTVMIETVDNTPIINNQLPIYRYENDKKITNVYPTGRYLVIDLVLFELSLKLLANIIETLPELNLDIGVYGDDDYSMIIVNKDLFEFTRIFLEKAKSRNDNINLNNIELEWVN